MLLKPEMFSGNLDLGQSYGDFVTQNVQKAIATWEPVYYIAMLGYDLYHELLQAFESGTVSPELQVVYNMTLDAALRFVYTHYVQDNRAVVSGMGITVPEAAEARAVAPFDVQRERWNEGVKLNMRFMHCMRSNGAPDVNWQPDNLAIREEHLLNRMSVLGVWERLI